MTSELITIDRKSQSRGSVIFVHGLDGDTFETWGRTEAGDEAFWPDWLAQEPSLAELSLYSLGYSAERTSSSMSLHEIGRNVLGNLKSTSEILEGPIAFVCHGLGGLVVKQVLRRAYEERERDVDSKKLIENTAQVVFIATPHRGSTIAALVEKATRWPLRNRFSRITLSLSSDGETLPELHNWYSEFCDPRRQDIEHLVFIENRKLHGFMVVDEASATFNAPRVQRFSVDADHMQICKPKSRNAEFYKLTRALLEKLPDTRPLRRDAEGYILRPEREETQSAALDASRRPSLGAIGAAPLRLASGLANRLAEVRAVTWGWLGIGTATVALAGLLVLQAPSLKSFGSDAMSAPPKATSAGQVADRTAEKTKPGGSQYSPAAARLTDAERRAIWAEEDAKRRAAEASRLEEVQIAALKAADEQQARQAAEEARHATAAAAKALEAQNRAPSREAEDRLAQIEQDTDQGRLKKFAADWPDTKPAVERRLAVLSKMTSTIQDGLRRTGCFEHASTGNWLRQTRAAAELFNKHAPKGATIAVDEPTPATEETLSRVKARVCPGCTPPQVKRNGICVFLECPMGQVRPAGGECETAYVAWIGYDASEAGASTKYAGIRESFPLTMRGKVPDIKVSANGARYSVRVGPGATKDDIGELCRRLKEEGFPDKCIAAPH